MSIPIRSFAIAAFAAVLALALALTLSAVVVPVATADAATLTACVNKKNGNVKMRFGKKAKKKCPKGWKKVRWNDSNTGALAAVYSGDGKRVGKFLGSSFLFGPFPIYAVQRDGGQYLYETGSGDLLGIGSPDFTTADCTGPGYLGIDSATPVPQGIVDRYVASLLGPTRIVFRTEDSLGNLGVPRAWTGSGTSEVIGAGIATYDLNGETGACEIDEPAFTGVLISLRQVTIPTPYDFVGPLTVR